MAGLGCRFDRQDNRRFWGIDNKHGKEILYRYPKQIGKEAMVLGEYAQIQVRVRNSLQSNYAVAKPIDSRVIPFERHLEMIDSP